MTTENINLLENISITNSPEDFSALYNYFSILSHYKEYDKCAQLLELLIDFIRKLNTEDRNTMPQLSKGYCLIAQNHIKKGEIQAAAGLYLEGLEKFTSSDELHLEYGKCLIKLNQFERSNQILSQIDDKNLLACNKDNDNGLYIYQKYSALGELYQNWGKIEEAQIYFDAAINYNKCCVPAHIGLAEIEIIKGRPNNAKQYLSMVMDKIGEEPALILTMANIEAISSNFIEAYDYIVMLKGELLGEDRFEYILFLIDFLKGDYESLLHLPNFIKGETIETEAARIWINNLKGIKYEEDASRIPEEIWKNEYIALNKAWEEIIAYK